MLFYLQKVAKCLCFLFLFLVLLVLFGIICIEYLFPAVTFNQIYFHAAYLDFEQLSFWWVQIAGVFLLSLIAATLIYKKPISAFLIILLVCGILCKPLRVSDIKEDKPISLAKQIKLSLQSSDIYEKYYKTPELKVPESKKNIIVIFAESMEDNFSDATYWGENLIPNLSKLKREGTSFHGYYLLNGTNWTLASNISLFCGVPLKMQMRDRLGTATRQFLPNVKCLSDITHELGYKNVFATGTYISFVGTDMFVEEHNFDEIYGRDEIIAEDEANIQDVGIKHFGINDEKMFEFARHKISNLAKNEEPFFMAIQTLDTHFPNGYVNEGCSVKYGDTRDSIKCSEKIIYDFVRWCQQQDFWDNTIIVLVGDHLMMTSSDIADLLDEYPKREIYNVVLEKNSEAKTIFKPYSMLDWSATVADKAGIISSDNFGLGISLFRKEKTLIEKLGAINFEEELLKNSSMYNSFLGISSHLGSYSDKNKIAENTALQNFQLSQDKMIAHACGSIDGHVYTNSLEALNLSASRGYKYVEIDLLPLMDKNRGFYAAHDYEKFRLMTQKRFRMDRKTIKSLKIFGKYSPLTDDMILDFFEKHPDMWLVTDKVTDFELLNEKFGKLKDRMIIEFWDDEQYKEAQKYGFKHLAYSLNSYEDFPLVLSKKYEYVTVSMEFLELYKKPLQTLRKKRGVKVMAYTVANKNSAFKYDNFADMLYYDGEDYLDK